MKNSFLTIKEPCNQGWENMSVSEKGRFCSSCQKDVHDFSNSTLDEIKENDYNLNIPRYVDTFEEEEAVDLKAVSNDLKLIDKELIEINKEIIFCNFDSKLRIIKEDLTLNEQCLYLKSSIKEISKENLSYPT